MKTETDYRHIWLYAKHHYVRSKDIAKDLGIILGHRSGIDPEYFDRHPTEIVDQLTDLAWDALHRSGNPPMRFADFLKNCSPEGNWKVDGRSTHDIWGEPKAGIEPENHHLCVLRAILSLLALTAVYSDAGEALIEIGCADPAILPLSKGGQKIRDNRTQVEVAAVDNP